MDLTKLKGTIPDAVIDSFQSIPTVYQINTPLRASHFIAQTMHESGNFKILTENLNYSAKRLKEIFPKYFPELLNEQYERQPEKIASRVYANRMGNGDEASKDGWKYRGRGYIQLTGKNNYVAFGKAINEDLTMNPDIVATPKYALISAAWYWNSRSLNPIADNGSSLDIVKLITKKINGGTIGLDERYHNFTTIYNILKA